MWWDSIIASPYNLHSETTLGAADRSHANALNEEHVIGPDLIMEVVGWVEDDATDTRRAGYWLQTDGDWSFSELESLLCEDEQDEWYLREATDVNDHGWIVGYGERTVVFNEEPYTVERGFVMIPMADALPCIADIVPPGGDGRVSIADVNAVVGEFNCVSDCTYDIVPHEDCSFGDGRVSIADVIFVIQNYNSVCAAAGGAPPIESAFAFQTMDFSAGYPDENGDIQDFDDEVSTAWATFSSNYDVHRLWVTLENETDKLEYLGGDDVLELALVISVKGGTFYNHGQGTNKAPNPSLFESYPSVAFDTFITMGSATEGSSVTILGTLNLTSNTLSTSTGWYKLGGVSPVPCGEDCWRVLVGQIAVTEGAVIEGGAQLLGDGIDEYAEFSSEE